MRLVPAPKHNQIPLIYSTIDIRNLRNLGSDLSCRGSELADGRRIMDQAARHNMKILL